jgi:hypothetical protein
MKEEMEFTLTNRLYPARIVPAERLDNVCHSVVFSISRRIELVSLASTIVECVDNLEFQHVCRAGFSMETFCLAYYRHILLLKI